MAAGKPTYDELRKENLSLKMQLAVAYDANRLYDDMRLKNAQLEEMNEELRQTFEQLKKNKEHLEKVENQYKILASNISDVIWILDLSGNFTYISSSAANFYGYLPKDLEKATIKKLLTDDSFAKFKLALSDRIEKEKRGELTGENTYIWSQIKKNGEIIWTEIISNPLRDETNRLYAILGVTRDITNRKLAEEKTNMLSVAVEQSPNSIVITDIDGTIEYVNTAFTRITGYTYQEAIGKNPRILQSGQTPKKTFKNLWKIILSGKTWHGEFINRKKDGELYWESATIAPIKDNNGTIVKFVAIKDNITSQKFSELDLKKSQERLKLLSDISLEGTMLYEDGRIINISQSLLRITGFSADDLLGIDPINKLFSADSVDQINEKIMSDYHFPFEAIGKKNNGNTYPVELEMKQLKFKGHDVRVVAIRDLTYRKKVDEVMKSSLRLTEMITDRNEQQIIDWGLEEAERISESNCAFFHFINDDQKTIRLITWSNKTLKNCVIHNKASHYPIEEAGTWVDCFYERKPIVHNDYQSLKHKKGLPEGHFPLFRYISLPVMDGDKVRIIFGVGNKKEDYNQFDVDVLALLAKTIWMVIQRKRTENKLNESNQTKAKFLSIISHDLRSPLGSIGSLSEMMLENIDILPPDELQKYIKIIGQTSKTAYDLLENMLIWSRAQSDMLEYKPQIIQINEFISNIIEENSYLSKKKGIDLKFIQGEKYSIYADMNMLTTAFRNLIVNSIKFTPQNGSVTVITSKIENKSAEIKVCDTGIGISPERLKNLFNIEKNMSTVGTENEKGSGLGLLLCKEFIEKNNGQIQVESQVGKGTSFIITFPVINEASFLE